MLLVEAVDGGNRRWWELQVVGAADGEERWWEPQRRENNS